MILFVTSTKIVEEWVGEAWREKKGESKAKKFIGIEEIGR